MCKDMTGPCPFKPDRLLNTLGAYEHLAWFTAIASPTTLAMSQNLNPMLLQKSMQL